MKYSSIQIEKINKDIEKHFPHLFKITEDMTLTHDGVSRLVMLDRYAQKDTEHKSLGIGDLVVLVVKEDPQFPTRGLGEIIEIDYDHQLVKVKLEEEFKVALSEEEINLDSVTRSFNTIDKPLELYYEQIAKRVAKALSRDEKSEELREKYMNKFYEFLSDMSFVPAGRVLFGAGSGTEVTYFNCFVMPMIHDSRGGISDHRKEVMEIMSRGGGVGTNGSTLRPKNARAKGVGGKSSGSVSWLNDLSQLTHLVEQGGSRRGAQMIMMADWHPDVIEFIISKMQNPKILQFLIDNSQNELIVEAAKAKLDFKPLTMTEEKLYREIKDASGVDTVMISEDVYQEAIQKLNDGGTYSVHDKSFLSGANISINITDEFMQAVVNDEMYALRFPDVDEMNEEEKTFYNQEWHKIGDVREWEKLGHSVKVYHEIRAKDLWDLINICATYSAEPGIFFIDNANKMTNAIAYNQKVVATNPCGEQPLAPYSVCNLAAINLANFVEKHTGTILYDKLKEVVRVGVRMQDNVIDTTPYFLEANREQALGERRIGLGIMGLHDLLIWNKKKYGSVEGNAVVEDILRTIAITAYEASIELAKEKGSFPLLDQYDSRDRLVESGYIKKMPDYIREDIKKYGIRNSHLLTIAPTGSTGTMVGVSTGLEPYFSFKYFRSGRLGKFMEVNAEIVEQWYKIHGKQELPDYFISAMDLDPEEHVEVQCIIQNWVDSSISKTVNAPKGYTVKQVEKIYEKLYLGGAKGGTVYVDGSRDAQVLSLSVEEETPKAEQLDLGLSNKEKSKEEDVNPPRTKHGKNIGDELGDICPICNEGEVIDAGGCHTCSNCGAQLRCGL